MLPPSLLLPKSPPRLVPLSAPPPLLTLASPSFSPVLDPCCSLADPHCSRLPPFPHCPPSSPATYLCSLLPASVHPTSSSLAHQPERLASASPLPPRSIRLLIRCPFAISILVPWLTKSSPSPSRRAVKTRATSCSSLLEEPQAQLLLFGTPLDSVRDTVHWPSVRLSGNWRRVRSIWFVGALPSNC